MYGCVYTPRCVSILYHLVPQDEEDVLNKKRSNHVMRKLASRKPQAKVDPHVEEQFLTGRLLGTVCVWEGGEG